MQQITHLFNKISSFLVKDGHSRPIFSKPVFKKKKKLHDHKICFHSGFANKNSGTSKFKKIRYLGSNHVSDIFRKILWWLSDQYHITIWICISIKKAKIVWFFFLNDGLKFCILSNWMKKNHNIGSNTEIHHNAKSINIGTPKLKFLL